ncbi:hypothetical protein [Salibacterium sp. K-3]
MNIKHFILTRDFIQLSYDYDPAGIITVTEGTGEDNIEEVFDFTQIDSDEDGKINVNDIQLKNLDENPIHSAEKSDG